MQQRSVAHYMGFEILGMPYPALMHWAAKRGASARYTG